MDITRTIILSYSLWWELMFYVLCAQFPNHHWKEKHNQPKYLGFYFLPSPMFDGCTQISYWLPHCQTCYSNKLNRCMLPTSLCIKPSIFKQMFGLSFWKYVKQDPMFCAGYTAQLIAFFHSLWNIKQNYWSNFLLYWCIILSLGYNLSKVYGFLHVIAM